MASDALDHEPECVELLVIRARAHIALRRDLDAQADLRDIIRLEPQCGLAYRLLGELAARRDENESAAIFFREALRLQPDDTEASDWLMIVDASIRPAAAARKIPAPAVAAGRFPRAQSPRLESRPPPIPVIEPAFPRQPMVEEDSVDRERAANETVEARPASRVARGTFPPNHDERPTKPFARGSRPENEWAKARAFPLPAPTPSIPSLVNAYSDPNTLAGRPAVQPPAKPAPKLASPSRPMTRGSMPELPGFGEYLVETGILTRERLRAAQAYQRSMRVQLSTAIVTLGLATPQRIEWAAVAHQSQLARNP